MIRAIAVGGALAVLAGCSSAPAPKPCDCPKPPPSILWCDLAAVAPNHAAAAGGAIVRWAWEWVGGEAAKKCALREAP